MAIKPESAFIQAINRQIRKHPDPPHSIKFADRFTNGLPDTLYIGKSGICLWVEYKVHPNKVTMIQLDTLNKLAAYNQRIAIITKHPTKITINDGINTFEHDKPWQWIIAITNGVFNETTNLA